MESIIVFIIIGVVLFFLKDHFKSPKTPTRENQTDHSENLNEESRSEYISLGDDRSHLPERFIVADIETTGLSADRDKIIEIAALRIDRESNNLTSFSSFVNPLAEVPEYITKMTGITTRMAKSGGTIENVMPKFLEFCQDLPIVFYNASFDMKFLLKAARGVQKKIGNEIVDALYLARSAFPQLKNHKLPTVARHLRLDTKGAHRALNDCVMTLQVFNHSAKIISQSQKIRNKQRIKTKSETRHWSNDATNFDKQEYPNIHFKFTRRHFNLQGKVSSAYKNRKDTDSREKCKALSEIHIKEMPELLSHFKKLRKELPSTVTFQYYANLLTEDEEFDRAIEVCEQAIALGLHDGTKTGFQGRIARIKKKQDKATTQTGQSL